MKRPSAENPDLVRKHGPGYLKGVAYTLNSPNETFEICKKYVEGLDQTNQEVQKQGFHGYTGVLEDRPDRVIQNQKPGRICRKCCWTWACSPSRSISIKPIATNLSKQNKDRYVRHDRCKRT